VDASPSFDPDGMIVSYLWDFGDGTTESGVDVSHIYSVSGTYTINLTVVDEFGVVGEASKVVNPALPPADTPENAMANLTDIIIQCDLDPDVEDALLSRAYVAAKLVEDRKSVVAARAEAKKPLRAS